MLVKSVELLCNTAEANPIQKAKMKVVALSVTAQARGEREGAGTPTSVFCHGMAPVRTGSVRVHTLHSGFCLFVLLLRDSENPCPLIDLVREAKHQGWRPEGGAKLETKEPCGLS